MSAKILTSLTDEKRNRRKQSGCINGIFQLFDHHHFLTGRHVGSHNHERLLTGAQHQLEPLNATKAVKAKHLEEQQKEKARLSTESPRASYSSFSCSSTFASISERPLQTTAVKEHHHSQINVPQSSDIRAVLKDSMYRDTSLMSIKSLTNDVRKVNVMKHLDSPRPRFSYDGRELRDEMNMKFKELPRLSLESKLNFLGRMENEISSKPGSHTRSSSIVAKLMGLDDFPDANPSPRVASLSKSPRKAETQKGSATSASPRLHNADSVRKPTTSSKMAEKASESTPHSSASVYGEIEKRITELEFKGSGKDLRALKQIPEAMQKTKQRMENKRGVSPKPRQEDRKTYQEVLTTNKTRLSKSTNVMEKVKIPRSMHLLRIQSQDTKYQAHREKAKDRKPRNSNKKEPIREKISCRKKEREKGSQNNRQHRVKSIDLQLSEESESCHGDKNSVKSESNKSVASHIEAEAVRSVNLIKTNCRGKQKSDSISNDQTSAVEMEVTIMEQPSPVSVLDATFYSEDSPSPIKKKSTVFQDEAEWHLENLNHSADCRKSDPSHKYNQKPENTLHLLHEPRSFQGKPNETAAKHIQSAKQSLIPDHRYINKILLASGLLKDARIIIPTANQLLPTCNPINPNIFHALEETEEAHENLTEKNDEMRLNQKIQRKIVFDVVNEMLVHKITSGRLFTMARKRMSPQRLMSEVHLEMDNLCRMPYCSTDDEDDGFTRLLSEDMKYQADDWTDYSGEAPALVLDIERLIFKELINEVVMGEVVAIRDWSKRQCRQLFTK